MFYKLTFYIKNKPIACSFSDFIVCLTRVLSAMVQVGILYY